MSESTTEHINQHESEGSGEAPNNACVEVEIACEPGDVWHAITSDGALADWMGEGASIGSKPGDAAFFPDVATGVPRHGVISTFQENRELGYTWWPQGDSAGHSHVLITLQPCEVGTRVTVTETMPQAATVTAAASASATATMAASGAWLWRTAMLVVAMSTTLVAA